MNFHTNEWIMEKLQEHYQEALEYFPEDRIVGIFLQGSQNYGLDVPNSDVDTKLIVVPTFEDIAFNRKPISTTHIRENEEHIDFKDIRLMLGTFRKQNLNFLEILFTEYAIINPIYKEQWERLVVENEAIARYNTYQAVKSMKGIAMEKYHAMEHLYPSKVKVIEKFGYDPKQLHHLLRVEDYLKRYISDEAYKSCLQPSDAKFLKEVKEGKYTLDEAREMADFALTDINNMTALFTKDSKWNYSNPEVDKLLNEVQLSIMKKAITKELQE